jgi:hypothetical protein
VVVAGRGEIGTGSARLAGAHALAGGGSVGRGPSALVTEPIAGYAFPLSLPGFDEVPVSLASLLKVAAGSK